MKGVRLGTLWHGASVGGAAREGDGQIKFDTEGRPGVHDLETRWEHLRQIPNKGTCACSHLAFRARVAVWKLPSFMFWPQKLEAPFVYVHTQTVSMQKYMIKSPPLFALARTLKKVFSQNSLVLAMETGRWVCVSLCSCVYTHLLCCVCMFVCTCIHVSVCVCKTSQGTQCLGYPVFDVLMLNDVLWNRTACLCEESYLDVAACIRRYGLSFVYSRLKVEVRQWSRGKNKKRDKTPLLALAF